MNNIDHKICILNYGYGNTGSIKNMLKRIGFSNVIISAESSEILSSSHLILPGVGRFDKAMESLHSNNLVNVIFEYINLDKPLLGICLGMQLLANHSQEGNVRGLGLIDFNVERFDATSNRKVPHMGMNTVLFHESTSAFDKKENSRFYFVHSYYAVNVRDENVLATTIYDGLEFVSAVIKDRIVGVQFHPEKSHHFGMKFLKYFVEQAYD